MPPARSQGESHPSTRPPAPPTPGPTKHARDTAKTSTAHTTNRTPDHDLEHTPVTPPHTDLVQLQPELTARMKSMLSVQASA